MQVVGIDAQQNVKKLAGYILYGPATASVALDPIGDVVFGLETLWQHGSANYLSLLLLGATHLSTATAKFKRTAA